MAHGPVVEEIYHKYKNNGSNGIEYQGDYDNLIDNDTTAVLEEVYDVFGKYSAWGLRNMTHQEDSWLKTLTKFIGNGHALICFLTAPLRWKIILKKHILLINGKVKAKTRK